MVFRNLYLKKAFWRIFCFTTQILLHCLQGHAEILLQTWKTWQENLTKIMDHLPIQNPHFFCMSTGSHYIDLSSAAKVNKTVVHTCRISKGLVSDWSERECQSWSWASEHPNSEGAKSSNSHKFGVWDDHSIGLTSYSAGKGLTVG